MPGSYPISSPMVLIGDVRVGKDISGKKLITNEFGEVSWTFVVPDLPAGSHEVKFTDGAGKVSNSWVTVQAGILELSPYLAIRGQTVFAKSQSFLDHGGNHNKAINERQNSGIWLAETRLQSPYVEYPIRIAKGQELLFPIRLKPESIPRDTDSVQIMAIEQLGMVAAGSILFRQPLVSISHPKGIKGSEFTVSGTDFVVGKDPYGRSYRVTIQYGDKIIGYSVLNKEGAFKKTFIVPDWISPGSKSSITAEVESIGLSASTSHSVPETALSIDPQVPTKGELLTITGSGYPAYAPLYRIYFSGGWLQPAATMTDSYGNFSVSVQVPVDMRTNDVKLTVNTQYFSHSYLIPTIN